MVFSFEWVVYPLTNSHETLGMWLSKLKPQFFFIRRVKREVGKKDKGKGGDELRCVTHLKYT